MPLQDRFDELRRRNEAADLAGGADRIARQHQAGKKTARERVELLLDKGSFAEIDRLQKEPPPEKELRAVQNYLAGTFVLQNSTRQGIIGQLANLELQGLSDDYLKTWVQKVNAVTPAQVSETARKHFSGQAGLVLIAFDSASLGPDLRW